MKIQKIIHADGSVSFATEGIVIVKNKEDITKQKIVEIGNSDNPPIETEKTLMHLVEEEKKKPKK